MAGRGCLKGTSGWEPGGLAWTWLGQQLITRTLLYPGPQGQKSYSSKNKALSPALKTNIFMTHRFRESGGRHSSAGSSVGPHRPPSRCQPGLGQEPPLCSLRLLSEFVPLRLVAGPQGPRALASGCPQPSMLPAGPRHGGVPFVAATQVSPPPFGARKLQNGQNEDRAIGGALLLFLDPTAETRQLLVPLRPGRNEDSGWGCGSVKRVDRTV